MSEQYEPSYYEIALTGRQVLAAFVILLVCLVAAFFSGVWVGRGGRGDQRQMAQAVAQKGPADEPKGRELSFFDEKPAAGARTAAAPGASATAAVPSTPPEPARSAASEGVPDRHEAGAAGRAAAAPTGPATPPRAAPAAGGASGAGAARAPGPPPPEAREASAGRRPAATATPVEANPSGSLATGDVVIQVFSSGEEAKAREVLDRLEKHGFRAFLSPVVDGGRTLYRVRVGPFEHKSEAEAVAEKLHKSLNLETWITQ